LLLGQVCNIILLSLIKCQTFELARFCGNKPGRLLRRQFRGNIRDEDLTCTAAPTIVKLKSIDRFWSPEDVKKVVDAVKTVYQCAPQFSDADFELFRVLIGLGKFVGRFNGCKNPFLTFLYTERSKSGILRKLDGIMNFARDLDKPCRKCIHM